MSFIEMSLYSDTLQMNVDVDMVLPAALPGKKLKVLWLYHGGNGDHGDWVRSTNAIRFAEERRVALIMPGVHNSCFVDMLHGPTYGTYIGKELPDKIGKMFIILSEKREDNYVAGFSNGGYGCIRTALLYPETFGYAGAFAAGDQEDNPFINDGGRGAQNRVALFGDGNLQQTEYSLKYCARKLLNTDKPLPKIYHACGEFDPWYDKNQLVRLFFEGIKGNPFNYHYIEYKGLGHTDVFREKALNECMNYWDLGVNSAER